MTRLKDYILLFLKGIGMGGADVVPGVSGGTIAFITGIYEELLNSIKSVDLEAIKLLSKFKWKAFWEKINGRFLVTLIGGIAVSLLTLSKLIGFLLANYPIQLWSFFFGLVIISSILVAREIKEWKIIMVLALIIGVVIAFLITEFTPAETPESWWFIFISGAIAICAMILPGISGSFILLILGKYTFVINAVNERNIPIILIFGLGCIVGILSFSRLLSWLLNKFHNLMVAFLSGFMIGSLNKIWPWKETIQTYVDRHGVVKPLVQENVLPTAYQALGNEPFVLQAILFGALGIGLVVFIEKLAHLRKSSN
ncbi:DUF368 domain-containing protein [Fulvivirgaceae bacterium BMA12]|uniref:DUF368 domain-containing protein n=1 Tax=Agaribacillus aureus TaxID=3051825 RepID=A0ABT8LHL9_9BACT|nr:DUF368 domain-containing protein [Fulvivirgaceae bacterium BMA12]